MKKKIAFLIIITFCFIHCKAYTNDRLLDLYFNATIYSNFDSKYQGIFFSIGFGYYFLKETSINIIYSSYYKDLKTESYPTIYNIELRKFFLIDLEPNYPGITLGIGKFNKCDEYFSVFSFYFLSWYKESKDHKIAGRNSFFPIGITIDTNKKIGFKIIFYEFGLLF